MREGITRREMVLGNLAGLLGGIIAMLLGPWLGRGRAAPGYSVPPAPAEGTDSQACAHDPLNRVATYTYDAGGRLTRLAGTEPANVTTYTYTASGPWWPDGWQGEA